MGLKDFAGWLATQVFDVVGSVAGAQGPAPAAVDLQVGKIVFHDVPAKMRTELWLSQLQRKGGKDGDAPPPGEYYDLLFEPLSEEVLADIDKDTHRTFPGHPRLSTPEGQRAMLNVLRAYAASDPEIGYTQGMNFLAGLLLTYLPSEPDAYAALALLMHQRGLREMYLPDMALLQIRLWQLGKLLPPALAAHLEAHAVLPVLYASSWLLTCFAADFPLHFAGRVMDVLMTGHQVASPMLKVAVALLTACGTELLRMHDFEEIVGHLRQEVPRWPRQALQELLTDAFGKPWTARQLRVLDQINGAETVMEAVARVNNLSQQPTQEAAELAPDLLELSGASSISSVAPSAAAAGSAEAAGLGAADSGRREQAEQPSPRSIAHSLSRAVRPAAAPAGSAAAAVAWDAWQPADLQSLATTRVHIERSIGDVVELDPQLSQALSAYPAALDAPAVTFAALPAVAEGSGGADEGAAAAEPQAAQQAQQEGELTPRSAAEAQAKWAAFASHSTRCLSAIPSPFGSRTPTLSRTTTPDAQQLQSAKAALQLASGGGAAGGGGSGAAAAVAPAAAADSTAGAPLAPTLDSCQLDRLTSAAPLVAAGAPAPGGRQGKQAAGAELAPGASALLKDVPSSHGSTLAALNVALQQLGLSIGGAGAGGAAGGAAARHPLPRIASEPEGEGSWAGDARRLRHSSESDEFGSWKTAGGSGQEPVQALSGSARASLAQQTSWPASCHASAPGSGGPQAAAPGQQQQQPLGTLLGSGSQAQDGRRLSCEEAGVRAASLQEQHIQGFLSSGRRDAARQQQRRLQGL